MSQERNGDWELDTAVISTDVESEDCASGSFLLLGSFDVTVPSSNGLVSLPASEWDLELTKPYKYANYCIYLLIYIYNIIQVQTK